LMLASALSILGPFPCPAASTEESVFLSRIFEPIGPRLAMVDLEQAPAMSALGQDDQVGKNARVEVIDFPIPYPKKKDAASTSQPCVPGMVTTVGSTHEITYDHLNGDVIWITGQNYDTLVKVSLDGKIKFYPLPSGSGPHGIEFDAQQRLWVTFEFLGKIARLDDNASVVAEYDVRLDCTACPNPINPFPHGLSIGPDGETVWFTGKGTGTVGKISPNGEISTFELLTAGAVPIYIKPGPDGNMWVSEAYGNAIARVTPDGKVTEYRIPTPASSPVAIVPEPDGEAMWFTEQQGSNVARIDMKGNITEFPIRRNKPNQVLSGLAFDNEKNLWVEQFADLNRPKPRGRDHVLKIDKSILTTDPSRFRRVPIAYYPVPTRVTGMHRIIQGPDGAIWFTELAADKVGKVTSR